MDIIEYDKEAVDRPTPSDEFANLYIDLRQREKRVLSDTEVMFLPDIDASHIHYKEWQIRKRSASELINYLAKKNKPLNILEIGCGNGWLSSKLSAIASARVTGLDINQVEILQAKRVFKKYNLEFIWSGFEPGLFEDRKFNIILFAASVQYFPSLQNIIKDTLALLAENGEIHLTDTHFYKNNEADGASKRTEDYYAALGCPEMASYYFHHSVDDIMQFNHKVLVDPGSLFNRIGKKRPFYWVTITH